MPEQTNQTGSNTGATASCAACHRQILWTGKQWEHVGQTPRHPARPPTKPEAAR